MFSFLRRTILALMLILSPQIKASELAQTLARDIVLYLNREHFNVESVVVVKEVVQGKDTVGLFKVEIKGLRRGIFMHFPLTFGGEPLGTFQLRNGFMKKFRGAYYTHLVGFDNPASVRSTLTDLTLKMSKRAAHLADIRNSLSMPFINYPPGRYLDSQILQYQKSIHFLLDVLRTELGPEVKLKMDIEPGENLSMEKIREAISVANQSIKFIEKSLETTRNPRSLEALIKGRGRIKFLLQNLRHLLMLLDFRGSVDFEHKERELLGRDQSEALAKAKSLRQILDLMNRYESKWGVNLFRETLESMLDSNKFIDFETRESCEQVKSLGIGAKLFEIEEKLRRYEMERDPNLLKSVQGHGVLVEIALQENITRLELAKIALGRGNLTVDVKNQVVSIEAELKVLRGLIEILHRQLEVARSARTKVR